MNFELVMEVNKTLDELKKYIEQTDKNIMFKNQRTVGDILDAKDIAKAFLLIKDEL